MTTTAASSSATTALERAIARTLEAFIRRSQGGGSGGASSSSNGQSKSGVYGGGHGVFLGKSRSVLRLTGKDGKKLLQGLLTNDVDLLLDDDDNNEQMYAAMLTPKGRIVTDVFLTKGRSDNGGRRNNDEILIDSCQLAKETLLTQIVRRKLRSDVCVEDASEELSVRVMPPSFDTDDTDGGGRGNVLLPADPRWFGLGRRGIVFDAAKKTYEDAELDEKVYANWRTREWRAGRVFGTRRAVSGGIEVDAFTRGLFYQGLLRRPRTDGAGGVSRRSEERRRSGCF